jgi:hypothetical protein
MKELKTNKNIFILAWISGLVAALHNCIQKYLTKYFSSFKLTIHKDKGVLEQDNTALRRFLLFDEQINRD